MFTPFYKLWQKVDKKPVDSWDEQIVTPNLELTHLDDITRHLDAGDNQYRPVDGWKQIMAEFDLDGYDETRNGLDITHGTSTLSPYVRFGLLSIRQVYEWA